MTAILLRLQGRMRPEPSENTGAATRGSVDRVTAERGGCDARDALEACVRRIAAGEDDGLNRLYDLTVARVYSLARAVTGSSEDAEEVSCETYVQVWNEAARFDSARGSVLGWLMSICRSRALDARRRRLVRARADRQEPPQDAAADGPEDLLALLEKESAVRAAVAGLSPLRRQLIALAFFQGMTHAEIAQAVALPLGTVKSHLRRALGALRECLEARC
jgi:RNA polymerase sigma-70 factor (ECF subfamily)